MNWGNDRTNFDRNIAVVIGINEYQNGIHKLSTPVNDAKQLAELLEKEYEYEKVIRLFPPHGEATLDELKKLLFDTLPNEIKPTEGDRLLFYFAGHGIARNSEDGPAGYLVPQDAQLGKLETFLPMRDLNTALSQLNSHHLLVILDCCFAGNFRWSSTRNIISAPETIHREHYDRFIRFPAWQAITSAAHNQEALDFVSDLRQPEQNSHHSPFALALIEGLKDLKADFTGDGVIVAPELYMYLRDRLIDKDGCSELQTPGLWPLQRHDRGEFIFTLPGFEPEQLKPAPLLDKENNPYRGLEPFDEKHARFFFGRQELVEELYQRISSSEQSSSRLTVVSGISGSGKSSLVKAGLIPYLRKNHEKEWHILEPMRPGKSPVMALAKTFKSNYEQLIQDLNKGKSNQLLPLLTDWLVGIVRAWSQANPQVKLLLTIDQFEELITMSGKETPASSDTEAEATEQQPQPLLSKLFRYLTGKSNNRAAQKGDIQLDWQQFVQLLDNALKQCPQLHIVLTLRSDFEPRFVEESAFKDSWEKARFSVRPMRSDELRQAIEGPASEMALYFEPPNLVDRLIDEVAQMPGALPLLSFTLSELYIKLHQAWIKEGKTDRALTLDLGKFDSQGGIAGSLSRRANEIYESLDNHQKTTMRRVMLRMVTLQGGEPVRRKVSMSELDYPDSSENERKDKIIGLLDQARLVVKGKEEGEVYVEPAHDYLVRGWDKLQEWLSGEQETLPLQRRLTPAAIDWKSKQESRFLWNADPYLDVLNQVLTDEKDNWFNQVEAEFVQKSVRRRRRNVNLLWGSAIGVTVVSLSLTTWALFRQRDAEIGRISTSRQASEALFLSNQQLEALISGSRARKNFSNPLLQIFQPNSQLQEEVLQTLRKVFYGMKERNRWEPMQGMEVQSMFFHPNGELFIATKSNNNGTVQLWDMQTKGKPILELPGHEFQGDNYYNVFFSPDGSKLATVDSQGIVRLWDWNGNKLNEFQAGYEIEKLSFSPNGQSFVTRGYDNKDDREKLEQTVSLWNLEGRSETLAKAKSYSIDFGFRSDGSLIKAYETASERITLLIPGLPNQVIPGMASERGDASLSPDGNYIVLTQSFGDSYLTQMWKRDGSKLKKVVLSDDISTDDINAVYIKQAQITSFSSDSKLVAFANNNTIRIYNLSSLSVDPDTKSSFDKINFNEIKLPSGTIQNMVFSQDGKYIATKSENGTVRLWNVDVPQPDESKQYRFLKNDIQNISFSRDRKTIAIVGNNGTTIRLFDSSGKQLSEFPVTSSRVTSISFSPDSKIIATGQENGIVSLFNQNGKELEQIKAHLKNVKSIVFNHDGQRLGTLGSDSKDANVAKLWKFNGDNLELEKSSIKEYAGIEKAHSVRFNANEDFEVVIEVDNAHSLADVYSSKMTGEIQEILPGELKQESSDSIAVSPDGSFVASVGRDSKNIIKLWDLQNENLLMEFKYNECNTQADQCITSISFSPDGSTLAVIGVDGSAKFWHLGSFDDLLAKGCDRMRDYLATLDEKNSDRHLCDDIPPITPSPQTTTANSSAPSIVQPLAQNAPSPAPASNNRQDTASSSAPPNAPAPPQNVPSPTPPSNNGQNSYEQALSDRKQASKLKSVDVYINRGLTYHRQGKYKQAISNYSQAIALNPNSDKAYSNRAAAYNEQKDYPKAIADSSKAISLNPNYANAYINRGLAYYYQGNSQQAIANYNKAIELAPGNANAYHNRALAYTRLGKQQAAQEDKRKVAVLSQRQLR